ncbi:MAG: NUDIX hydrolase [Thermodesulfobacteriota bacterium]
MSDQHKESTHKESKRETVKQISAGGVLFRESGGQIEIALIATRGGRVWGLPKGLAEAGENLARTAHREVEEETGLTGKIIKKIDSIHYWYSHKEGDRTTHYFKIVYFFLMKLTGGDTARHDHEVDEVRWFPIEEALKKATYPGERDIIRKARELLRKQKETGKERPHSSY